MVDFCNNLKTGDGYIWISINVKMYKKSFPSLDSSSNDLGFRILNLGCSIGKAASISKEAMKYDENIENPLPNIPQGECQTLNTVKEIAAKLKRVRNCYKL